MVHKCCSVAGVSLANPNVRTTKTHVPTISTYLKGHPLRFYPKIHILEPTPRTWNLAVGGFANGMEFIRWDYLSWSKRYWSVLIFWAVITQAKKMSLAPCIAISICLFLYSLLKRWHVTSGSRFRSVSSVMNYSKLNILYLTLFIFLVFSGFVLGVAVNETLEWLRNLGFRSFVELDGKGHTLVFLIGRDDNHAG